MQAVAEATKNIYKEVADRNSGASPDPLKTKTASCAANDANCYDHTNNTGIGSIRVSQTYPPPEKAPYNYAEVLHKSFIFYFQQRSGKMPQQVNSRATTLDAIFYQHLSVLPLVPSLGSLSGNRQLVR